jgi:6-phosphogluconolactonase
VHSEVHQARSLVELNRIAAELICAAANQSVESYGFFSLVLAGGNTPRQLYELLAAAPFAGKIPWHSMHLFWGDERWVVAEHPDSNFNMAAKSLLARIDIPAVNIHRIRTDLPTVEAAATVYEKELRDFFSNAAQKNPGFALVLLGMGTDGHTASLFPNSPALNITNRLVAAVRAPNASPPVDRITLTLSALNKANDVLFLISGRKKIEIMQSIVEEPKESARLYPAARVRPRNRLVWLAARE